MIQAETIVNVSDNSNVKKIKCLKISNGRKVGSFFCASILALKKSITKSLLFKKGDLVFAILIQTKFRFSRKDGEKTFFLKNSAILIDYQIKPQSSRILIPLFSELRKKKYIRFLVLSSFFF